MTITLVSESAKTRLPALVADPSKGEDGSCMVISGGGFKLFLGAWHRHDYLCRGALLDSRTLVAHAFLIPVVSFSFSEARRRSAFKTLMIELSGAWLNSSGVDADWIADKLIATMDEYVLNQDQAMKELIKKQGGAKYEGKEYSLTVSHDKVDAQPIQIDCVYPDYLKKALLTPGSRTVLYPVHEELGIQAGAMTCDDFAKLMCGGVTASAMLQGHLQTILSNACFTNRPSRTFVTQCFIVAVFYRKFICNRRFDCKDRRR